MSTNTSASGSFWRMPSMTASKSAVEPRYRDCFSCCYDGTAGHRNIPGCSAINTRGIKYSRACANKPTLVTTLNTSSSVAGSNALKCASKYPNRTCKVRHTTAPEPAATSGRSRITKQSALRCKVPLPYQLFVVFLLCMAARNAIPCEKEINGVW